MSAMSRAHVDSARTSFSCICPFRHARMSAPARVATCVCLTCSMAVSSVSGLQLRSPPSTHPTLPALAVCPTKRDSSRTWAGQRNAA